MLMKADRLRLKKLFSKAILRLCKSNLWPHSEFQIEAMIGITFGESDVALICINEMVTNDGDAPSQIHDNDRDMVAEEFEYQELESKAFGTAEGHHVGNEPYVDVLDAEKCEMRWVGGEAFGRDAATGCEDAENGAGSGQDLYDNKMADDGKRSGAIVTAARKRKTSFAAGSDQFSSRREFDHKAEGRVTVKEEPGLLNESDFNEAFDFERTPGSGPVMKPQSPSPRIRNPDADFVSYGVTSISRFRSWPSVKKNIGLQCGRKLPTATTALQSHVRSAFCATFCRLGNMQSLPIFVHSLEMINLWHLK